IGAGGEQHAILPRAHQGEGPGRDVSLRAWRAWHGDARWTRDRIGLARACRGMVATSRIARGEEKLVRDAAYDIGLGCSAWWTAKPTSWSVSGFNNISRT